LLEKYTLEGQKVAITGKVDLQYSLRNLLAECSDFKDEETVLSVFGYSAWGYGSSHTKVSR
jgi:hypothetical protein